MEPSKYYIPSIEQFKKGFTYEVKSTYRYETIDFSTREQNLGEPQHIWTEYTLTEDWDEKNIYHNTFDLKTYLENGTIRAKI